MKNIASALVSAQKAFGPALKTSTNPHFKNRYADLAACVDAVMSALNDNGVALLQTCHECASGVMVETVFLHESGESWAAGKLHVPAAKNDPQGYGSALTYARRYSLMAACGIAPEDDDGNAAQHAHRQQQSKPASRLTDAQAAEIKELLQATESDTAAFLAWVSKCAGQPIASVDSMPAEAYEPSKQRLINKQKELTHE